MLFSVVSGKQFVQRFGGTDHGSRVLREEIEEPVFAWHEFPKPAQHSIHP
jgi:hypothetical protein